MCVLVARDCCGRRFGLDYVVEEVTLIAAACQCLVDRVSGSTKWIQHWTVLADW